MDNPNTPEQIQDEKSKLDQLSQEQMARLWRFAPSGHPYFDSSLPLFDYFINRFFELGGMTPSISKRIGW